VDFDCAEANLAAYGEWLAALRGACGKTPLVFTALPVWLRHEAEFIALAKAADGFVLQVHSLEKPTSPSVPFTLCEPERALAWARQAGVLAAQAGSGITFRVALPTYGYELGFDAAGKFIGIAAESPRDWPQGTQLRTVRTDASAMAALAAQLASAKIERATGVIWFRLPVAGDRLVWDAVTFDAVVSAKPLVSRLVAEVRTAGTGLVEIVVRNRGQTTLPLPPEVRVSWLAGQGPVASDGLRGYTFAAPAPEGAVLRAPAASVASGRIALAPGRECVIGWLRFNFSSTPANESSTQSTHAIIP
jgi:hypothetical protein